MLKECLEEEKFKLSIVILVHNNFNVNDGKTLIRILFFEDPFNFLPFIVLNTEED
jgi:hypothetical protein